MRTSPLTCFLLSVPNLSGCVFYNAPLSLDASKVSVSEVSVAKMAVSDFPRLAFERDTPIVDVVAEISMLDDDSPLHIELTAAQFCDASVQSSFDAVSELSIKAHKDANPAQLLSCLEGVEAPIVGLDIGCSGMWICQCWEENCDDYGIRRANKKIAIHAENFSVLSGLTELRELDLGKVEVVRINDEPESTPWSHALGYITGLEKITSLSLHKTAVDAQALDLVRNFKRLRSLDLSETSVRDLSFLDGFSALQSVNLAKTIVNHDDLKYLTASAGLRVLNLEKTRVRNSGMVHVAKFEELASLSLHKSEVSSAGLATIVGLQKLKNLDLANLRITDAGLAHISKLTSLENLNLQGLGVFSPFSSQGLALLVSLQNLRSLDLQSSTVTDEGLAHFGANSALRELNLYFTKAVTGDGLAPLTGLEWLKLDNSGVTDLGLSSLAVLKNLKYLSLYSTKAGDNALLSVADNTNINRLYLANTHITNEGLAHLSRATALQRLNIEKTDVSDAGLVHLAGLEQLKELKVYGTQVTKDGLRENNLPIE